MDKLLEFLQTTLDVLRTDGLVNKVAPLPLVIALGTRSFRSYPLITIEGNGESTRPGPMANTSTRLMQFVISAVFQSADANKYLDDDTTNNVFAVSDRIRLELAENKSPDLGDDFRYGLEGFGSAEDNSVVATDRGFFTYRALEVTYSRLEVWTGARNNQTTLKAPVAFG